MMQSPRQLLLFALLLLMQATVPAMMSQAHAEPECAPDSRITQAFDNGASWDMCWESRIRENLVLTDVHYQAPDGQPWRVLSSARLSQLHVAYDDSDVTYNDVTQFGLGGPFLLNLSDADCPNGNLLNIQTRPTLCVWLTESRNGFRSPNRAAQADSLNIFSISQVGAYAYISSWTFYDDGSFEPGIGATGALQRSSDDTSLPFGRVLQGDPDTLWLSHTHNYYWRLDFDLGDSATDDVVSELRYQTTASNQRELITEVFTTEQARKIDPQTQQLWHIADSASSDAAGFQIEPVRNGHRFERKEIEPYTEHDFFVTVANDCERFASQNARFNPDCLNHVLQFVDGQSVQNQDIVVWNRVAFHHVPRSEDQRHMHTHWDGFMIRPVNLLNGTATLAQIPNTAPTFDTQPSRSNTLDEHVHEQFLAQDADQDILTYSATGLPTGLVMDVSGQIHGETLASGVFSVTLSARDDHSEANASFTWTVARNSEDVQISTNSGSGSGGVWWLVCLSGIAWLRNFHSSSR